MCLESCRRVKIYSNELFCWMLMDFHYYFSGFPAEDAALQRRREEASQEIARILPLKHKRFCSEAWLEISNRMEPHGDFGHPILRNSTWKAWMQRSSKVKSWQLNRLKTISETFSWISSTFFCWNSWHLWKTFRIHQICRFVMQVLRAKGILGLTVEAHEISLVQQAFRSLMRKLHPDRIGQCPRAAEAMEMLQEAKQQCETLGLWDDGDIHHFS